jgi:hypothetical protein
MTVDVGALTQKGREGHKGTTGIETKETMEVAKTSEVLGAYFKVLFRRFLEKLTKITKFLDYDNRLLNGQSKQRPSRNDANTDRQKKCSSTALKLSREFPWFRRRYCKIRGT